MINQKVLMSGADYFSDEFAINAYMDSTVPVNLERAKEEHQQIRYALGEAGIEVIKIDPPADCQDGIYTANWALCRGNKAVMASLPNKRKGEEPHAEKALADLGFEIIKVPEGMHFSGQGDALPCGNYLFMGSVYRTSPEVHTFVGQTLGYDVVSLQTKPLRTFFGHGKAVINPTTGWADSYYYDIDLALAVIKAPDSTDKGLIAWCPEAFMKDSAAKIRQLPVDQIEVSLKEAKKAFACNLVSTGETVVMSAYAPKLQRALEDKGLKVIPVRVQEISKGGGFIRCTSLTLSN